MMLSNAHGEAVCTALQPAEMERRMMRVAAPELIILDGEFLNISGERME